MIYRLENPFKNYDWGDREKIEKYFSYSYNETVAEVWLSSHPLSPSSLIINKEKISLLSYIKRDPISVLGEKICKKYNEMPFMLKILASKKPLSLQLHPKKNQAMEGFLKENKLGIALESPLRNYKDKNSKPEMLVALEDFYTLVGFAEIKTIIDTFDSLSLFQEEVKFLKTHSENGLLQFFRDMLLLNKKKIEENLLKLKAKATDDMQNAIFWILKLNELFPGDPAIFSPLYMNLFKLKKDQAIFIKSGVLHAHLQGAGIEVMGNSDNVLRAGCTKKQIDLNEILKNITIPGPKINILNKKDSKYDFKIDQFNLLNYDFNGQEINFLSEAPSFILIKDGTFSISGLNCTQGDSFFVECATKLNIKGHGKLFIASAD